MFSKTLLVAAFAATNAIKLKSKQSSGGSDLSSQFADHMNTFGLSYSTSSEQQSAYNNYANMDAAINQMNASGSTGATHAHNHLSTLSPEAYQAMLGLNTDSLLLAQQPGSGSGSGPGPHGPPSGSGSGSDSGSRNRRRKRSGSGSSSSSSSGSSSDSDNDNPDTPDTPVTPVTPDTPVTPVTPTTLPTSVNWVTADSGAALNPIENQGQCGSCYSFATTCTLETHNYLYGDKTLYVLSEQMIVSCANGAKGYGLYGCNGGNTSGVYQWVKKNGIVLNSTYPYKSGKTQQSGTCSTTNSANPVLKNTSYKMVAENDVTAMKTALANVGPLAVGVDANSNAFQSYSTGVLTGGCGSSIDHLVTAVGYGTDATSGNDYWLVRNSWGTWWGDQGYIKIGINSTINSGMGVCGVQNYPGYPIF